MSNNILILLVFGVIVILQIIINTRITKKISSRSKDLLKLDLENIALSIIIESYACIDSNIDVNE